jgi:hypothetical protein
MPAQQPTSTRTPPEDESADPVGDGVSDAEWAEHLPTPGREPHERDDRAPNEVERPVEPDRGDEGPERDASRDGGGELEPGPGR